MSSPTTISDERQHSHATPPTVEPQRNKIQALQRRAKSLLYHRPIQCYIRLAKMVRDRLTRGEVLDEGKGVSEDQEQGHGSG